MMKHGIVLFFLAVSLFCCAYYPSAEDGDIDYNQTARDCGIHLGDISYDASLQLLTLHEVIIENIGTSEEETFPIAFFISTDETLKPSGDILLLQTTLFETLKAGASITQELVLSTGEPLQYNRPEGYSAYIVLDFKHIIEDSNYLNNMYIFPEKIVWTNSHL